MNPQSNSKNNTTDDLLACFLKASSDCEIDDLIHHHYVFENRKNSLHVLYLILKDYAVSHKKFKFNQNAIKKLDRLFTNAVNYFSQESKEPNNKKKVVRILQILSKQSIVIDPNHIVYLFNHLSLDTLDLSPKIIELISISLRTIINFNDENIILKINNHVLKKYCQIVAYNKYQIFENLAGLWWFFRMLPTRSIDRLNAFLTDKDNQRTIIYSFQQLHADLCQFNLSFSFIRGVFFFLKESCYHNSELLNEFLQSKVNRHDLFSYVSYLLETTHKPHLNDTKHKAIIIVLFFIRDSIKTYPALLTEEGTEHRSIYIFNAINEICKTKKELDINDGFRLYSHFSIYAHNPLFFLEKTIAIFTTFPDLLFSDDDKLNNLMGSCVIMNRVLLSLLYQFIYPGHFTKKLQADKVKTIQHSFYLLTNIYTMNDFNPEDIISFLFLLKEYMYSHMPVEYIDIYKIKALFYHLINQIEKYQNQQSRIRLLIDTLFYLSQMHFSLKRLNVYSSDFLNVIALSLEQLKPIDNRIFHELDIKEVHKFHVATAYFIEQYPSDPLDQTRSTIITQFKMLICKVSSLKDNFIRDKLVLLSDKICCHMYQINRDFFNIHEISTKISFFARCIIFFCHKTKTILLIDAFFRKNTTKRYLFL